MNMLVKTHDSPTQIIQGILPGKLPAKLPTSSCDFRWGLSGTSPNNSWQYIFSPIVMEIHDLAVFHKQSSCKKSEK